MVQRTRRRAFMGLALLLGAMSHSSATVADRRALLLGGEELATPISFVVSVQQYDRRARKHSHLCGGVLLADEWVATTQRCLEDHGSPDKVFLNRPVLDRAPSGSLVRSVVETVESAQLNLALLKLDQPLGGGALFASALLSPAAGYPLELPGANVTVAGWVHDMSQSGGEPAPVFNADMGPLRQLQGALASSCEALGPGAAVNAGAATTSATGGGDLCLRVTSAAWSGKPARCFGDEGAPVFARNAEGDAVVVGLVTAHGACGAPVYEARALRLSARLAWIESKIGAPLRAPTQSPTPQPSRGPSAAPTPGPSAAPSTAAPTTAVPSAAPATRAPSAGPSAQSSQSGGASGANKEEDGIVAQAMAQPLLLGAVGGGTALLLAGLVAVGVRRRQLAKGHRAGVATVSSGSSYNGGGGGRGGGGMAIGAPTLLSVHSGARRDSDGSVKPEELSPRGRSTSRGFGWGGNSLNGARDGQDRVASSRFIPKRISGII